jgi:hypothetical protein
MKDKRTYINHKEHGEDISHENERIYTNEDRGPLDLELRLENKDKIIDKLRMNIRDSRGPWSVYRESFSNVPWIKNHGA